MTRTVTARAPAKLNLFLELCGKRNDGFHELDTVMVPIEWYDHLSITAADEPGVSITVAHLPSQCVIANRSNGHAPEVPNDETNLVYRALSEFSSRFVPQFGFRCQLCKQIPAGAGLGGASSNAAAALRCAAALVGSSATIAPTFDQLHELAADLGSDVPFFLGDHGRRTAAARATGRGEVIRSIPIGHPINFVVIFPGVALSTAEVYANSLVPHTATESASILSGLRDGDLSRISRGMMNRLSNPARKIVARIDELLESLWRSGLLACQLTGSGSACFGIARSNRDARRIANRLRATLEPGMLVMPTRTATVPGNVIAG